MVKEFIQYTGTLNGARVEDKNLVDTQKTVSLDFEEEK